MPAPSSPAADRGPAARARASYANPAMRVSDAERAEVADRLSGHFGDGRLDQEEFDKRLHQAMSAVTQADLGGLFADLPDGGQAAGGEAGAEPPGTPWGIFTPGAGHPAAPARDHRRGGREGRQHRLLALVLIVVAAAVVGHAVASLFLPWVVVAVVVLLLLRFGPRLRHRG